MNNTSDENYNETHMHVVMPIIHLYYIFGDWAIGWSVKKVSNWSTYTEWKRNIVSEYILSKIDFFKTL